MLGDGVARLLTAEWVCVMTMESVESIPLLRSPRTHVGEIRAARRERARDTNLYKHQLLYDK
jgi:hypothetical protein